MTCIHQEISLAVAELNKLSASGADSRAIQIAETRVNRAVAVESSGMLWRTDSEPYGRAVSGTTQALYLPGPMRTSPCIDACADLQDSSLTALQSTRCVAVTTSLDVGIAISLAGKASENSHFGSLSLSMV